MVISYSYLWRYESDLRLEEGNKNRPCVIILAVEKKAGGMQVTVAPITHTAPSENIQAVSIPSVLKRHLHLDEEPSWIVTTEVNQFTWPGYDLRTVPGEKSEYVYGFLPPRLFNQVKSNIVDVILKNRGVISRD